MAEKGRKRRKAVVFCLSLGLFGVWGCAGVRIPPPKVSAVKEGRYKMVKVPPPKETKKLLLKGDVLEPVVVYPSEELAQLRLLDKKITIAVYNVELSDILKAIGKVSNVDFVYGDGVDKEKKISFQVHNRSLKEVLDLLSQITGYYYEVKDRTVFIKSMVTKYYDVGIPKVVADNKVKLEGNLASTSIGGVGGISGTAGATGTAGTAAGISGYGTGTTEIKLKYENLKNKNPYKRLRKMLDTLIKKEGEYVLDEDTGVLMVTTKPEILKKVDILVHKFKYFYSKQVDVEVTMIQVSYTKGSNRYINWSALLPKLLHGTRISYSPVTATNMGGFVIRGTGSRGEYFRITNAILSFLKNYGNTEIVASPRLRLTNGYSAMVVAGSIEPYWRKEEQFLTTGYNIPGNAQNVNVNTEITKVTKWIERDYLQGVTLNVKARINDRNEIYLLVTPMLTDIVGEKQTADGQITAPIMVTRQATTLLKVHDGDIVILAGLRGKKLQRFVEGTPGLMNLKGIGKLASSKRYQLEETELVIVIRAKLVY